MDNVLKAEASQIPTPPPVPILHPIRMDPNHVSSYKKPSEDLNLVDENVYIGCLEAACNVDYLKSLNITHVLTVEDHPLDDLVQKHFTYKFFELYDLPSMSVFDILEESIEFIKNGVKTGGVLVHCLGKS